MKIILAYLAKMSSLSRDTFHAQTKIICPISLPVYTMFDISPLSDPVQIDFKAFIVSPFCNDSFVSYNAEKTFFATVLRQEKLSKMSL